VRDAIVQDIELEFREPVAEAVHQTSRQRQIIIGRLSTIFRFNLFRAYQA
jgi:hypothetical protein